MLVRVQATTALVISTCKFTGRNVNSGVCAKVKCMCKSLYLLLCVYVLTGTGTLATHTVSTFCMTRLHAQPYTRLKLSAVTEMEKVCIM